MTKQILISLLILIINFTDVSDLQSQVTGGEEPEFEEDSVIIFNSPRPLKTLDELEDERQNGWGGNLVFSTSGFGGGLFWRQELSKEATFSADFFVSGARNSDELEYFDRRTGELFVPNKLNRLFNLPLIVSLKYYPFVDEIKGSFKPFVSGGPGFSFIAATPYDQEFFSAFGDGQYFIRPAFNLSIGAEFGGKVGTISSFQLQYYYIPFGGDGLRSMNEESGVPPIKNFGGLFLSLTFGLKY